MVSRSRSLIRDENQKKEMIRKTAYRVMNQLGFDAASYSEIADCSGYGRPLVQMYFPKKDQFVLEMTEDYIELIFVILNDLGKLEGNSYEKTLRIAQVYFAVNLRDEQAVRLTRETLAHRSMMKKVFELYQMKAIALGFDADPEKVSRAIIKALGGIEELAMDDIDKGKEVDPCDIACQLVAAMQVFLDDASYKHAYSNMKKCLLSKQETEKIASEIVSEVLSLPRNNLDERQYG